VPVISGCWVRLIAYLLKATTTSFNKGQGRLFTQKIYLRAAGFQKTLFKGLQSRFLVEIDVILDFYQFIG